jgi:hypothetical protein
VFCNCSMIVFNLWHSKSLYTYPPAPANPQFCQRRSFWTEETSSPTLSMADVTESRRVWLIETVGQPRMAQERRGILFRRQSASIPWWSMAAITGGHHWHLQPSQWPYARPSCRFWRCHTLKMIDGNMLTVALSCQYYIFGSVVWFLPCKLWKRKLPSPWAVWWRAMRIFTPKYEFLRTFAPAIVWP